jgi:hypothetical protein
MCSWLHEALASPLTSSDSSGVDKEDIVEHTDTSQKSQKESTPTRESKFYETRSYTNVNFMRLSPTQNI